MMIPIAVLCFHLTELDEEKTGSLRANERLSDRPSSEVTLTSSLGRRAPPQESVARKATVPAKRVNSSQVINLIFFI